MDGNSPAETPHPVRLTTVIPSDTAYLEFLASVLKAFCRQTVGQHSDVDKQFYFNIELVMTEAVVNCIRHAYRGECSGPVELELEWAEQILTMRVADYGSCFSDFETYAAREIDELDPMSTGGRGIIIIRSLMDHLSYSNDPDSGRNLMEMSKSFHGNEA